MKTIYVFDDFSGNTPVHMGNLYVDVIKGGESYSFEYTEEWLKQNNGNTSIHPDLFPFVGRQFPNGNSIFGVFSDASPDRWGRVLMNKKSASLPTAKSASRESFLKAITFWAFMMRHEWAAFALKQTSTESFYPSTGKPPHRHGQRCAHWRRLPVSLKTMTR